MRVPAKVVQEILGHSHVSITLGIYAHVLPGMQQEAMDTMDDLFGNDDEEDDNLDEKD
jgi:integrase